MSSQDSEMMFSQDMSSQVSTDLSQSAAPTTSSSSSSSKGKTTPKKEGDKDDKSKSKNKKLPSSLPLLLPKGKRKSLLCEMAEPVDISADTGTVGIFRLGETASLDLKGKLYKGTLKKTPSILVVSVGTTEAQIEEIHDEVLSFQLVGDFQDAEHLVGDLHESEDEDLDADVNQEELAEAAAERKRKKRKT